MRPLARSAILVVGFVACGIVLNACGGSSRKSADSGTTTAGTTSTSAKPLSAREFKVQAKPYFDQENAALRAAFAVKVPSAKSAPLYSAVAFASILLARYLSSVNVPSNIKPFTSKMADAANKYVGAASDAGTALKNHDTARFNEAVDGLNAAQTELENGDKAMNEAGYCVDC
jgi:hypothetical protein